VLRSCSSLLARPCSTWRQAEAAKHAFWAQQHTLSLLQVAVHKLFKAHHLQQPDKGFPPIPSVPFMVPVSTHTPQTLCYMARYKQAAALQVSESAVQRTAAASLTAADQLDQDLDAKQLQETQQNRTGKAERTYFLKRDGSNCGRQVLRFCLGGKAKQYSTAQSAGADVCYVTDNAWYEKPQNGSCDRCDASGSV